MTKERSILSKAGLLLRQFGSTAGVCAKQAFDGGIVSSISSYLVQLAQFILFILLWRGFAREGVDLGGMTEKGLLTYTLLSFALHRQLDIITPATSALWEGSIIGRYARPYPVYVGLIAETIGRWWIPYWALFTLPLLGVIAPLLGISLLPATAMRGAMFILSLLLSICIGFGLDMLFSSAAIRLKNSVWMVTRIREAIFSLLSGALIPFSLFPRPAAVVLELLPFGSIASAPLNIYTGGGNPAALLFIQAFWATTTLVVGSHVFKKSQERMVSYGG